ncbi:helix-turn-helix domain-containing protein (plasmid) [Neptuniibacter sp. QD72_48]|uniref:helix-turn-helix domain-containing protein n=1 Tax=Neptuniibacter sp. QD72_48 TaxID=3398214 RepID=UPI0039F580BC
MSDIPSYTIKSLRKALGINTTLLGQRIGITQTGITRLEQREEEGTITIDALKRAAQALNAEVKIEIIPNQPVADMLYQQAEKKAIEDIQLDIPDNEKQPLIETRIKWYLENPKRIWKDEVRREDLAIEPEHTPRLARTD